jgi:plastocyanin
MKTRTLATLAFVVAAASACASDDDGPSGPGQPSGPRVSATAANQFSPNVLDVTAGATVTWSFGAVDHDVVFNAVAGAPSNIGITRNANVSRSFPTAGNFPYSCTLHAGMSGTIRVAAAGPIVY